MVVASLREEDKITYGQGRNDNKNITAKLAFTPTDSKPFY